MSAYRTPAAHRAELTRDELSRAIADYVVRRDGLPGAWARAADCIETSVTASESGCVVAITGAIVTIEMHDASRIGTG